MGGTPSKILPGLHHGGANVLKDPAFYAEHGVTHALSICNTCPPASMGLTLIRHIDEADVPTTDLQKYFSDIVEFIHTARVNKGVVYVHCAAGVSRSSTAVVTYLITVHNLSVKESLDFVRTKREVACPNPGFLRQLQAHAQDPQTAALRSRIRAMHPHDVAMVEADLKEIREVLGNLAARAARGEATMVDPRDRILELMQQMQEADEKEQEAEHGENRKKVGVEGEGGTVTGAAVGLGGEGWGLTWIEEERNHQTLHKDELPR